MEPFADLPDALVRDLLAKAQTVAERVSVHLESLRSARDAMRTRARAAGLIKRKADLDVPREPSVVGIDGSYQVHRLTALDLCAAASVAVEGTAKEARRYWPEPFHDMWVDSLPHATDTVGILRATMISMELDLAEKAPHDLVMLDGSFGSLIIYLNQGLTKLEACAPAIRDEFLRRWDAGLLRKLKALLKSARTVALPKFTSRNELLTTVAPPVDTDGKTLGTLILEPGEYTTPLPVYSKTDPATQQIDHLPAQYCPPEEMNDLIGSLHAMRVVYFRPYGWLPSIRIELPGPVANSPQQLSIVLEGIMRQFFSPAVFEPFPLFLADRMVKSLGAGVAVIEQTVAQHVAGETPDIETTLLCLQNYRTEGGRGGV